MPTTATRQAAEDILIIADEFSCREQIAQCSERRAMHIAEIMQLAQRQAVLLNFCLPWQYSHRGVRSAGG